MTSSTSMGITQTSQGELSPRNRTVPTIRQPDTPLRDAHKDVSLAALGGQALLPQDSELDRQSKDRSKETPVENSIQSQSPCSHDPRDNTMYCRLPRHWDKPKNSRGPKPSTASAPIDRWLREDVRDQPWHGIAGVYLPQGNGAKDFAALETVVMEHWDIVNAAGGNAELPEGDYSSELPQDQRWKL
ncbi:MAG: hypothetical protein M1820_005488 [Bogoriella megaspora]|nr:MAG: hypothetical protein M1820_005488 [Bogoriella megaspora]